MRLSETRVLQLVEQDPPVLVLVDDTTGAEITLNSGELNLALRMIAHCDAAMGGLDWPAKVNDKLPGYVTIVCGPVDEVEMLDMIDQDE